MLNPELQSIVERLCKDGCSAVSTYITDIEAGQPPAPLRELDQGDQQKVLGELKSIMAVYEQR